MNFQIQRNWYRDLDKIELRKVLEFLVDTCGRIITTPFVTDSGELIYIAKDGRKKTVSLKSIIGRN